MSAPATPVAARGGRGGWVAGVLTLLLLAAFSVLLVVPSTAASAPAVPAARFLPVDATRGKVTLAVPGTEVPAELSDARLNARAVPAAFSATAYQAVPAATRDAADLAWYRETVTPVDGSVPVRSRLRVADDRGIWLVAQDWGDLGIAPDGLLELPADVAAGRTWTSSGTARSRADGELNFTNTSRAAVPDDPARASEGCLSVTSRTELTGGATTTWTETALWCPGKGVVAGQGSLRGVAYAVTAGGAPSPVTDAELAESPWDPAGLAGWRLRPRDVLAGDPTFGLVDAGPTGNADPGRAPVVAASGVVVFPTLEGGDLAGLVPRQDDLWAHWWARPGGTITSPATVGSLVLAPTTAHRVSAYRAGRTLAWNAAIDDTVVAAPLPVDDGVAVATVSGTLTLLDARTGTPRWSTRVGAGVHTALAGGSGVVVTADTGAAVSAWDVVTGQQRWQVDDAARPYATTLAVADGQVVVASGGLVTAYDATTGRRTWVREAGLGLDTMTVVGDQLWLGVDGELEAWSVRDGRRRWTRPGAGPATTAASRCTTTGPSVGLARSGGELVAIDADGTTRGSWALPSLGSDVLTLTCRGAGVDLTAEDPGGSGSVLVLRLGAG